MWYSIKQSPLCCGIRQFGRYRETKPSAQYGGHDWVQLKGTELDNYAFGQAEFTNEPGSEEANIAAFEELCEHFHLLHKTLPRVNKNHNGGAGTNKIFVAIFRKKLKK